MPDIPFVGGAYLGRSSNLNSQVCQNLFPVLTKDGKQVKALYGIPGLVSWSDIGPNDGIGGAGGAGEAGEYHMFGGVLTHVHSPCASKTITLHFTSYLVACGAIQYVNATGGTPPYSWTVASGGGSVSPGSTGEGIDTTYTAPATNPNCVYNPTILCTDSCGVTASVSWAVNQSTPSWAYSTFYCHTTNRVREDDYNCLDVNLGGWTCTTSCASGEPSECTPGDATFCITHCCRYGNHDVRTPAIKAAGCCPEGLIGISSDTLDTCH